MSLDPIGDAVAVVREPVDVETGPVVDMFRSENAVVVAVDASMTDLLGWFPEELIGNPSTTLIHHEDQNGAVNSWFDMITNPGVERVWRGRYRTRDGRWRWVETTNVYNPNAANGEAVRTRMRGVEGGEISLEERLREREQVLSRLADALPVGLLQFDTHRRVTFSNDKLRMFVGDTADAASTAGLFVPASAADHEVLDEALAAVLAGDTVADFEVTLRAGAISEMTCSIALRTLTDRFGEVTGGIACVSDVSERVQLRRSLERRASTDSLTGCLNRTAILENLDHELAVSTVGVATVFIDLDGFKQVNDQFGHLAGDAVLREVVARLTDATRTGGDRVGRIGGDEFLVVCVEVGNPERADALALRFGDAVRGLFELDDGRKIFVRASAGSAWGPPGIRAEPLIAEADRQMYLAKPMQHT